MAEVVIVLEATWTCSGCEQLFAGPHRAVALFAAKHVEQAREDGHWNAAAANAGARVLAGYFGGRQRVLLAAAASAEKADAMVAS